MWIVNFSLTTAVVPGEVVGVCGSVPELGNWDVDKSVLLSVGDDGRVWSTDVEFNQSGRVEYRFVKVGVDGARRTSWEARLVNRMIDVGCEDVTIHASVSQSSVLGDRVPFLALNNSNSSTFASTLPESLPWWQVSLPPTAVTSVYIVQRRETALKALWIDAVTPAAESTTHVLGVDHNGVSVWRPDGAQTFSSLRIFSSSEDDLAPTSLQLASVAVLTDTGVDGRQVVVVDDALDWDCDVLTQQSGGVIRLCFGTVAREVVLDHPSITASSPWAEQFSIVCDWLPRAIGKPCSVDRCTCIAHTIPHGSPSSPDLTVSQTLDAVEGIQIVTLSLNTLLAGTHVIKLCVNSVEGGCLGVGFISTKQLHGTSGTLHVDVLSSSLEPVGTLTLAYTILMPFIHAENNISATYRSHWKPRKESLLCGHRGVGRSFKQQPGYRMAAIRENTLLSFATAAAMGTDFIEFDVMLSSDSEPYVYHDFAIEAGLVEETGSDAFTMQLGMHQLPSRAMGRVAQHHVRPVKKSLPKLAQLLCKHWSAIVALAYPGGRARKPKSCKWLQAMYQPPTFASLFDSVPAHVGLDVEIKYPTELQHSPYLRDPIFEINHYVDAVLKVVFDHARGRRLFFTCFHPEVCVALRLKQSRYPVLFLTEGLPSPVSYGDVRCLTPQAAVAHAMRERLLGFVPNAGVALGAIDLTKAALNAGLRIFTWGNPNNDPANVKFQRELGIDMIIADNIGDHTRGGPHKGKSQLVKA